MTGERISALEVFEETARAASTKAMETEPTASGSSVKREAGPGRETSRVGTAGLAPEKTPKPKGIEHDRGL